MYSALCHVNQVIEVKIIKMINAPTMAVVLTTSAILVVSVQAQQGIPVTDQIHGNGRQPRRLAAQSLVSLVSSEKQANWCPFSVWSYEYLSIHQFASVAQDCGLCDRSIFI